jgi:hypothetical protein
MRVYVFVMLRERWFTQCLLAEDMQTSISGFQYFQSLETIIKALRYLGAADEELDELSERAESMGRGSCTFTLLAGRKNVLKLKQTWLSGNRSSGDLISLAQHERLA